MTQQRAKVSAVLAGIVIGLFALDRALANVEEMELKREADQRYREGREMLSHGRNDEAVRRFQRALALQRGSREYLLSLVESLLAAGRLDEAETKAREVLNGSSNDGRANLLMARIEVRAGRPDDAIAFYHRAVYGTWQSQPDERRLGVRLELSEYLRTQERPNELLSELLVLQERAASDERLARNIAPLLLAAGSGSHAEEVYAELVKKNPRDVGALSGLGEARAMQGDYVGSQIAFLAALKVSRGDPAIIRRLNQTNALARLDPTVRRLSSAEKYRRSVHLLEFVISTGCADRQVQSKTARGVVTNEDAEERLGLAEKLWHECGASTSDAPEAVILRKLAREVQAV